VAGVKKCVRCGKLNEDSILICPDCGFDFREYEEVQKLYQEPKDPEVSKEKKMILIDNPILTMLFGILSVLASILFLLEKTISIFYLLMTALFVFLTYFMYMKPSKVKLDYVRKFGNLLGNIAVALTIFKVVFTVMGYII
jgi:hypothetical protein